MTFLIERDYLIGQMFTYRQDGVLHFAVDYLAFGAANVVLELVAVGVQVTVWIRGRIAARDVQRARLAFIRVRNRRTRVIQKCLQILKNKFQFIFTFKFILNIKYSNL